MSGRLLVASLLASLPACEASSPGGESAAETGAAEGAVDGAESAEGAEGASGPSGEGSSDDGAATGDETPPSNDCEDIELAAIEEDPDQGFIDVTETCVQFINEYRVKDGLEPFWVHEDGICCSALEARQAWLDGTHHNGDYCDWAAQGAAGGGRNPNGTAYKSLEWVPRLFYGEKGDTYEESGGHYQAMMRPEPRGVACGWYGHDRDNHRVVVNYW